MWLSAAPLPSSCEINPIQWLPLGVCFISLQFHQQTEDRRFSRLSKKCYFLLVQKYFLPSNQEEMEKNSIVPCIIRLSPPQTILWEQFMIICWDTSIIPQILVCRSNSCEHWQKDHLWLQWVGIFRKAETPKATIWLTK